MPKLWPFGKQQERPKAATRANELGEQRGYEGVHPNVVKHYRLLERLKQTPASQQESIAAALVTLAPKAIDGFKEDYRRDGVTFTKPTWHNGRVTPGDRRF